MKLPPKIGSAIGISQKRKPLFMKSGIDRYCPTCKHIFEGPDKGKTFDLGINTKEAFGPVTINRHRVSVETCPECQAHGISPVMLEGNRDKLGDVERVSRHDNT